MNPRIRRWLADNETVRPLIKFCLVGASGYVINLAVFAVSNGMFGIHHMLAAVLAFSVAVLNNFVWNRIWTFRSTDADVGFQALRFLTVSLASLCLNLGLLSLLHDLTPITELWAQAIAVAAVMPVNFGLNRIWTFARTSGDDPVTEIA
ncbi:MAG: GtrA family protein [Solirubrobacterales bacterium]|nr:GtrA family protein [Solirubrobacterales bacterium]